MKSYALEDLSMTKENKLPCFIDRSLGGLIRTSRFITRVPLPFQQLIKLFSVNAGFFQNLAAHNVRNSNFFFVAT
jgi:hypothetical protein